MNSCENQYSAAVYCCRNNMNQKYAKITATGIAHFGDISSFLCCECADEVKKGCQGPVHCDTITAEIDTELLRFPADSEEMQELEERVRDRIYDDIESEIEERARREMCSDIIATIQSME